MKYLTGTTGLYVIFAWSVISGIIMIATGNPLIWNRGGAIPEENLVEFARKTGVCNIVFGIAGSCFNYTFGAYFKSGGIFGILALICFAVMMGCIVALIRITKECKKRK